MNEIGNGHAPDTHTLTIESAVATLAVIATLVNVSAVITVT